VDSLGQRLAEIESRISAAAIAENRLREDIELIVVSKNHPFTMAVDLLNLGVRSLGENRDQEAKPKSLEVAEAMSDSKIDYKWHFIGQLQSNKVRSALSYASVVHSLDRVSLLDALIRVTDEQLKPLDVFIQLNLTQDESRGGIEPKNLLSFAEKVLQAKNLNLLGVMGVASLDKEPQIDFATILEASNQLVKLEPRAKFISAGMSEDFEIAIGFGATHLRIGSAITGKRVI
jgi:pyridoxal phosphate enzyme (YggS family)